MFCTIQLSKTDPTPLYIQLANELAHLIKSGILPPHTKLPTIRSLSHKLSINRDTVVSAYKTLENQGLIIAYVGSGTYVGPQSFAAPASTPSAIPCSSLNFPKSIFSPSILENILLDIAHTEGWNAFSDPLHREKNKVRESIGTFLKSVGIETSTAQLRLINDFSKFLLETLKLHPSHCICVEAYHDLTYTSFLRSLGIKLIEIPMTPYGICLTSLENALENHSVSFIFLSSYVQNPTGITYSTETKIKVLELAQKYNCYIIEDGTYSDFVYHYDTLTPLYSLDTKDRVIYIHHFSKLYLPYLQYSFIALPKHLSSRVSDTIEYAFNERVLHFYLNSPIFSHLRLHLLERSYFFYTKVLETLHTLEDAVEFIECKGGLFFWIKPLKLSPEEVSSIFSKNRIIISPGEIFSFKSNSPYFRLSLSQLTDSTFPFLIESLKALNT